MCPKDQPTPNGPPSSEIELGSPTSTDPTSAPVSADALTPNAPGLSNASLAAIEAIVSSPTSPIDQLISPGSSPTGRLLPSYMAEVYRLSYLGHGMSLLRRPGSPDLIISDSNEVERRILENYLTIVDENKKSEGTWLALKGVLDSLSASGAADRKELGRLKYRIRYLRRRIRRGRTHTRR